MGAPWRMRPTTGVAGNRAQGHPTRTVPRESDEKRMVLRANGTTEQRDAGKPDIDLRVRNAGERLLPWPLLARVLKSVSVHGSPISRAFGLRAPRARLFAQSFRTALSREQEHRRPA